MSRLLTGKIIRVLLLSLNDDVLVKKLLLVCACPLSALMIMIVNKTSSPCFESLSTHLKRDIHRAHLISQE